MLYFVVKDFEGSLGRGERVQILGFEAVGLDVVFKELDVVSVVQDEIECLAVVLVLVS